MTSGISLSSPKLTSNVRKAYQTERRSPQKSTWRVLTHAVSSHSEEPMPRKHRLTHVCTLWQGKTFERTEKVGRASCQCAVLVFHSFWHFPIFCFPFRIRAAGFPCFHKPERTQRNVHGFFVVNNFQHWKPSSRISSFKCQFHSSNSQRYKMSFSVWVKCYPTSSKTFALIDKRHHSSWDDLWRSQTQEWNLRWCHYTP